MFEIPTFYPTAERPHEWFTALFEERVAKIPPYPEYDHSAVAHFRTDKVDLVPERLAAVVLKLFPHMRFELLIGERDKPGYHWGDHEKILDLHHLCDDFISTFNSFYFEAKGNRYLMVNGLDYATHYGCETDMVELTRSMEDYSINTIFSLGLNFVDFEIDPDRDMIHVGDYLSAMDEVLRANYIAGLAEEFGWTNFEMLRFKAVGELPEWKPPAWRE